MPIQIRFCPTGTPTLTSTGLCPVTLSSTLLDWPYSDTLTGPELAHYSRMPPEVHHDTPM